MFNHDLAGTRYSPLTQINSPKNVGNPEIRVDLPAAIAGRSQKYQGRRRESRSFSEVPPIVVKGVMYLPAGKRVVALEPETSREIWSF